MTKLQFIILCEKHTIDPSIALENENITEALKNKDEKKVETILINEF